MPYRMKITLLLVVSTLVRFLLAASIQLGNDEVYYWTYAKFPDWSHFDHPPMVGFVQQLFTLNLLYDPEWALRLGFVLFGTGSTWLVYRIGKELKNERAGWIAALMYSISIYGFVISGVFVMPDGPMVFFWLLSTYLFLRFIKEEDQSRASRLWWLVMLFGALAVYSKYQGIFLFLGYALFILVHRRDLLSKSYIYLGLVFPLIAVGIIAYWNYLNNFSGASYHSDRVTLLSLDFNLDTFLRELTGQIIYNFPYNYILIVIALVKFRKQPFLERSRAHLMWFISLPLIGTTLFFSLYRETLPHWSGVAFVSMIPFAAVYLSEKQRLRGLKFSLGLLTALLLFAPVAINKGWLINSLGASSKEEKLGKNDPTLDMYGWNQVRDAVQEISDHDAYRDLPMVSNKWYPGSHLYYYVCEPLGKEIYVLGNMKDQHKYFSINKTKPVLKKESSAIYVTTSHNYKEPVKNLGKFYSKASLIDTFGIHRGSQKIANGYVYLLEGYKGIILDE